jgi:very-short-patch-repair endonuclease
MQPGQLFSHVTAARLYDFPLPSRLRAGNELDIWAETVQAKSAGTAGHRSSWLPSRLLEGLPVVAPVQVLIQIANHLSRDELVVVGDHLVRRKQPLSTVEEIHSVVREIRGVRGIRTLRLAARDVRPGTDSPMETKVRLALVRAGLPEPVIGYTIRTPEGAFIGTPDLAYIRERIAIEYEGDGHRTDRRIFSNDIERRELMQEQDWYVIRVVSAHLFPSPTWLVNRVRQQLLLRSRHGRADRLPSN